MPIKYPDKHRLRKHIGIVIEQLKTRQGGFQANNNKVGIEKAAIAGKPPLNSQTTPV
jgi:hypothetical protein